MTRAKPRAKQARAQVPAEAQVARVFWSGRSQAVRLPKEFRFDVERVSIRREGNCIILEPLSIARDAQGWPLALWELAGAVPDFDVGDRMPAHERGDVLSVAEPDHP